ncbi:MAG: Gldg family protein [Pseudomonadota bacterium]
MLNRTFYSKASLGTLALGFVVFVLANNILFSWARFDLTEDSLYSISKGTKNIIAQIDEPITLNLFFSQTVGKEAPPFWRNYAKRVREYLDEYELASGGKIRLNVIDPEPFSEAEDQAAEFGLQAVPVPSGDEIYFGLVGTNSVDQMEKIPFFDPRKEQFLEYDISKMIYKLLVAKKPVIGLISGLQVNGGMDPMQQRPIQPWMVFEQAKQLFEIRELQASSLESIDADVDVLMLVHPKGLTDMAKFAIDQYVLGGGKTLVFVDPQAEQDQMPRSQQNPFPQTMKGDDLNALFNAWGFSLSMDKVVVDRALGLEIASRTGRPVRHIGILGFSPQVMDINDVSLGNLERVIMSTVGRITPVEEATTEFLPLIQSSNQAALYETNRFQFLPDPSALLKGFAASGEQYTIAARITGTAKSAFPDGAPTADKVESSGEENLTVSYLKESSSAINIIVFADTDLLSNPFWVEVTSLFGQQIAQAFADNGDMVMNVLENMSGSSDLIGLRGRGRYTRPFDKVEELKLAAEEKFRKKEEELQQRLTATEQQLSQLRAQVDESGVIVLSPEQEAAIAEFQEEKLAIRKALRDVRHQLEKDIQSLGTKLKIINVGLVPIILIGIAIAVGINRRNKRRRQNQA